MVASAVVLSPEARRRVKDGKDSATTPAAAGTPSPAKPPSGRRGMGVAVRVKTVGGAKKVKGGGGRVDDPGDAPSRDLGTWHFPKIESLPPKTSRKNAAAATTAAGQAGAGESGVASLPIITHTPRKQATQAGDDRLMNTPTLHVAMGVAAAVQRMQGSTSTPLATPNPRHPPVAVMHERPAAAALQFVPTPPRSISAEPVAVQRRPHVPAPLPHSAQQVRGAMGPRGAVARRALAETPPRPVELQAVPPTLGPLPGLARGDGTTSLEIRPGFGLGLLLGAASRVGAADIPMGVSALVRAALGVDWGGDDGSGGKADARPSLETSPSPRVVHVQGEATPEDGPSWRGSGRAGARHPGLALLSRACVGGGSSIRALMGASAAEVDPAGFAPWGREPSFAVSRRSMSQGSRRSRSRGSIGLGSRRSSRSRQSIYDLYKDEDYGYGQVFVKNISTQTDFDDGVAPADGAISPALDVFHPSPPAPTASPPAPSAEEGVHDPTHTHCRLVRRRSTVVVGPGDSVIGETEEALVQVVDGGNQTDASGLCTSWGAEDALPLPDPVLEEDTPGRGAFEEGASASSPSGISRMRGMPKPLTDVLEDSVKVDPCALGSLLAGTASARQRDAEMQPSVPQPPAGIKLTVHPRRDVPLGPGAGRTRLQPRLAPPRRDPWSGRGAPPRKGVPVALLPTDPPGDDALEGVGYPLSSQGGSTPGAAMSSATATPGCMMSPPLHLALMRAQGPAGASLDMMTRMRPQVPWVGINVAQRITEVTLPTPRVFRTAEPSAVSLLQEAHDLLERTAPRSPDGAAVASERVLPWQDEIDARKRRLAQTDRRTRPAPVARAEHPPTPRAARRASTHSRVSAATTRSAPDDCSPHRTPDLLTLPSALKKQSPSTANVVKRVQLGGATVGRTLHGDTTPCVSPRQGRSPSPPLRPSPLKALAATSLDAGQMGAMHTRRAMGLDDASLSLFSFAAAMKFDDGEGGADPEDDNESIVTFRLPKVYKRLHNMSFIKEAEDVPEELVNAFRTANGHSLPVEHAQAAEATGGEVQAAPVWKTYAKIEAEAGHVRTKHEPRGNAGGTKRRGRMSMALRLPEKQATPPMMDVFEGLDTPSGDEDSTTGDAFELNAYGGVTQLTERQRQDAERLFGYHRVAVEELQRLQDQRALLRDVSARPNDL